MTEQTDMERIGLFKEMSSIYINSPYTTPLTSSINKKLLKGRQILSESTKTKSALNEGYFRKPFVRVFDGEKQLACNQIYRKSRNREKSKNISDKPFISAFGTKLQSGTGSYGGCLTEQIPYFSSVASEPVVKHSHKRQMLSNPGKKGTGSGYHDVGLSPYPEHFSSSCSPAAKSILYQDHLTHKELSLNRNEFKPSNGCGDYFDKNPYAETPPFIKEPIYQSRKSFLQKKAFIPSGKTLNLINTYPESVKGEYHDVKLPFKCKDVKNDSGAIYKYASGTKSCIYKSILTKNVEFRVNNLNSHIIKRVMNY